MNGDWNEDTDSEDFLEQIKTQTEEMRYGTCDGEIYLDASFSYNVEFLPHWREFAHALEQYQYYLKCLPDDDNTTMLNLSGMEIPGRVVQLLSDALESTHFHQLTLQKNNFGQRGIDFAWKYLQDNRILESFHFNDNPIENMKDIKRLSWMRGD